MKLLTMTNPSCFAYACAMVFDVDVQEIFQFIGHDGQEVWWPENEGAGRLRGVHIQEIMSYALIKNRATMVIQKSPMSAPDYQSEPKRVRGKASDALIHDAVSQLDGVLIGRLDTGITHAVAWCSAESMIYDPRGFTRRLGSMRDYHTFIIFPHLSDDFCLMH
jgi:hypothetical protein